MEITHLIVYHRDTLCIMLDYARNLGNAAKQGLKRPPIGWHIILRIQILGILTWTCHDPVGHTDNSTITTRTNGTTECTEGGGLSAKICCSSASALCQTGNKDGKIWNSPAIPCSERNSVLLFFSSEECSASEEVFASSAELCSDSFPLFPSLWNYGIAVTFCCFMHLLISLFSSLILSCLY